MSTSANAERRENIRRQFNGTVELALPDEVEGYEADGMDLSIGGMSLKTAYLPDVGSEMDCRFVLDGDDAHTVQARAQVVWARDNGADAGSFGLRFTEMDSRDRHAVDALIAPDEPKARELEKAQPGHDERVRLRLPRMADPLKAFVRHKAAGAMVVSMDLSFIAMGDAMEIEQSEGEVSHGRLEDVSVDIDPKTQGARLVLTVSLDDKKVIASAKSAPAEKLSKPSKSAARIDRTEKRTAPDAVAPAARVRDLKTDVSEAPQVASQRTEVLSSSDAQSDRSLHTAPDAELSSEGSSLASRSSAPAWLVSAVSRVRTMSIAFWHRASPALKRAWVTAATVALAVVASVRSKITGKPAIIASKEPTPRTRAAAPASTGRIALRKQRPESEELATAEQSAAPAMRKKYALIGLGAFGLSAIVFALATGGRERRPATPRPQVAVETTAQAPVATTNAIDQADPSAEPTQAPELSAPSSATQPSNRMPSDLVAAARSRNADVNNERPTVRTQANAARPAMVVARPAAATAQVATTRTLGTASVHTGTTLRLHFSGPITTVTGGVAGADSLTFRVAGRQVTDRAAGFVRLDSRLAGAGAYNRGGNAEVTLRFHGAPPSWAARVRGDVLEVTLAPPAPAAARMAAAQGARVASIPSNRRR